MWGRRCWGKCVLAQAGAVCEVQADPVRGAADWKLDSAGGVLNLVMVVIVGRQVVAPLARLWLWSMSTGTRSVVAPRRSSVNETSPVRNTCRAPTSTDTAATKMPIPSQQVTTTRKATSRGHVNEADHVHQGQHPSGKRNQACVDRRVARAAARCIRHPRKSAHGSRHPGEEVEILRLYCEWKVCFIIRTYRHAK